MKKIYLAALTLAMTACVSNDDLNPIDNYGYIDVNVSNDPIMVTRAEGVPNWIITATKDGSDYTEYTFESGHNRVPSGTYVITAKSHDDEATANTTNSWGEAFYSGSSQAVTITAGGTETATISCEKAKNSRVKTIFSLKGEQFKDYRIELSQNITSPTTFNKTLTITKENSNNLAYFSAGTVSFTFYYKYGSSTDEKNIQSSITCVAGTEHHINITSDDNGTITLNISFDNTFTDGGDKTITFDAVTGEQVTNE